MLRVARLKLSFNPDSIFFDQLSYSLKLCFDKSHPHGNRIDLDGMGRLNNIRAIRDILPPNKAIGVAGLPDYAEHHAERFDNITYLERHLETDEIFVLIKGNTVLISGENAELIQMETGNIYNVRKGTWHNIKVSKDALVLVVENADTCKENSEYILIDIA